MENLQGLRESEVQNLLKRYGYNELPSPDRRTTLNILISIFKEPMFLLLVSCGVIYLIVGNMTEAQMLLGFVFLVMGITFYQERKTERALQSLKNLSSPRALVIRDGIERRISGREIVPGDIVILSEGDRVPADGLIISSSNLYIDESLITGESEPVRKIACQSNSEISSEKENVCFAYAGGLVVRGYGVMRVTSTGQKTVMGKIGKSLQSIETEETLIQKEIKKLVKRFSTVGFFLCLIVFLTYRLFNYHWMDGILAGLTLAMAILPEEFPVVVTIFFALGAWRLSKHHVLTRRIPAIETLGATTVLCVDKTGTLTTNRMEVRGLYSEGKLLVFDPDKISELPETFHRLIEFGVLASIERPFDPMERAFQDFAKKYLINTEHIHHNWILVREYPLSENLSAMSNVWKSPDGNKFIISVKGSPEAIFDLCHFSSAEYSQLEEAVRMMAEQGFRVLGVAEAEFSQKNSLPEKQHDFNFIFIGLIGLMDPPRETATRALQSCKDAGIRVVMITGDYPGTARAIAKKTGLLSYDRIITGQNLEQMSNEELEKNLKNVDIFARIMPEQKLRIVNAFKKNGDIVAMTGDGVNDAPALKSAHIGIAMGERGTDVARESADIVLMNDDFSSIVEAIKIGRTIYDNLKKAMSYIISVHIPIIGMSLFPVLMGLPLVLGPVHIVFLEMVIDPACSTVFEAEPPEPDLMKRPPRKLDEQVLDRKTFLFALIQGIVVLCVVLAVFMISLASGHSEGRSRAITFTSLIVANIGLIFVNRSMSRSIFSKTLLNKPLIFVTAGALFFLSIINFNPWLRQMFKFETIDFHDTVMCVIAAICSTLWFEGIKYFMRKKQKEK